MTQRISEPTKAAGAGKIPASAKGRLRPRPRRFSLGDTFAALKYPNYRLWFVGQLVSLVGTWMQSTAQGFFIYELTKSPAYLGYVGAAAGIPAWVLTLYGGVIADRMPRRTLLILTQASMMILAFILAWLTFSSLVQPWHIIVLAFLLGIANAFDAPARQAFVLEMVERDDLVNAIALNGTMFNMATAVGPAVAGMTYAALGPAWCFTINGLSFVAVIIALLLMKLKPWKASQQSASAIQDILLGLKYVRSQSVILVIVIWIGVLSLFGLTFSTLFPAWAVNVLHGNEATNGWLQSARGVGALMGALGIAALGRIRFKGKILTYASFAFPILVLVYAGIRSLPLSLLLLIGIGGANMIYTNLCNALIQTNCEDGLRGRVMGVYSLSFFGLAPIGAFLAGQAAAWFGETVAIALGAGVMLAISVLAVWKVPWFRRLE